MFHVELAPWGVFLPSEVRCRGILALSRAWFYNGQKQKCKFLKKGLLPDFQILCGDSWGNFTKNGINLRPNQFFSVLTLLDDCVAAVNCPIELIIIPTERDGYSNVLDLQLMFEFAIILYSRLSFMFMFMLQLLFIFSSPSDLFSNPLPWCVSKWPQCCRFLAWNVS